MRQRTRFLLATTALLCVALAPGLYVLATRTIRNSEFRDSKQSVDGLAFNDDGSLLGVSHSWGTGMDLELGSFRFYRNIKPKVSVWDVAKTERLFSVDGDGLDVDLQFLPESNLMAAGNSSEVTLWNAKDRQPVKQFPGHCVHMAVSGSGVLLARTDYSSVQFFTVSDGRLLSSVALPRGPGSGYINCIAMSPDETRVAVGDSEQMIFIANISSSTLETSWPAHFGGLEALAFSPDGKHLASLGEDGQAKVWKCATHDLVTSFPAEGRGDMVFTPDGRHLVSATTSASISMRSTQDWREETTTGTASSAEIEALAISRDGRLLASGHRDGRVEIWVLE